MPQLTAHRAGTDLHARTAGHAGTQFAEREIWLLLDFRPQEGGAAQQRTLRTVRLGLWGGLSSLPLSAQPFLNGRQADMRACGDKGLSLSASEGLGQNAFP